MIETDIKYIFSTIKRAFLPAFFFACALILYYMYQPYQAETNVYIHYIFYVISAGSLCILYFVNRSKPFLTLATGSICYLLLNNLKIQKGAEFYTSTEYLWMSILLPLNLAFFYFLPTAELKKNRNFFLLIMVLAEMCFVQKFGGFISNISIIELNVGTMPIWAAIVWVVILTIMLLDISFKSSLIGNGIFYADGALFLGLIYADSVSACTTFFLTFVLILCVAAILDLRHLYRYDYLEGVESYQSYISQAERKFPFKYTIGLLCIDNRENILNHLGTKKMMVLEQMIADRIKEFPYEIELFRHERNELILVFKNETAKRVTDYAEDIRRTLAGSEFIFNNKENIKLTVSVCVSEKTRKDLNAAEVINRARNTLQKANSLNCNIVMKA